MAIVFIEAGCMLPIHTVSEANRRDHWREKAQRTSRQRVGTKHYLIQWAGEFFWLAAMVRAQIECNPPLVVKLTRIARRKLDDDNLRGALKAVRDGVADWLELDDGTPKVNWQYEQDKGDPQEFGVFVQFGGYE